MKTINNILIYFIFTFHFVSFGQNTKDKNEIFPFKIDETYLSGLEIPKVKLKAHPNRDYFQKTIYSGSELSVYILSSATATNTIKSFPIDEFVYYINGKALVKNDTENRTFYSGDYLAVPKGFSGNWTNTGGNTYHLELSVISNKRSKEIDNAKHKFPFVLDKDLLSGIGITKEDSIHFKDVLYKGSDLEISTISEKSNTKTILKNSKEQFIHILVGKITLTSLSGKSVTFYKGDFFIIPKYFEGSWESEGQDFTRYLRVIQI